MGGGELVHVGMGRKEGNEGRNKERQVKLRTI